MFAKTAMDESNSQAMKQIWDLLHEPKGILLIGNIGSGKTYLMLFFAAALAQLQKSFSVVQTTWITRDCIKDAKEIDYYGRNSFRKTPTGQCDFTRPATICFDDLGMEETETKIYGNSLSIMTDILIDRHIMFTRHRMKTHATSNLGVDALAEKYSDRSASRFREMFNVVILEGTDRRK